VTDPAEELAFLRRFDHPKTGVAGEQTFLPSVGHRATEVTRTAPV
jgi:hypothetical protein